MKAALIFALLATGVVAGCSRSLPAPGSGQPAVVFDSATQGFGEWRPHADETATTPLVDVIPAGEGPPRLVMQSNEGKMIAANYSLANVLYGRVEFEYQAALSKSGGENMFLYAIPIREATSTKVIEVGFKNQADPRAPNSKYRVRFAVPRAHCGDGKWHAATLDFDFRGLSDAGYTILGARINEGSSAPAAARVEFRNLKVTTWK